MISAAALAMSTALAGFAYAAAPGGPTTTDDTSVVSTVAPATASHDVNDAADVSDGRLAGRIGGGHGADDVNDAPDDSDGRVGGGHGADDVDRLGPGRTWATTRGRQVTVPTTRSATTWVTTTARPAAVPTTRSATTRVTTTAPAVGTARTTRSAPTTGWGPRLRRLTHPARPGTWGTFGPGGSPGASSVGRSRDRRPAVTGAPGSR